MKKHHILLILPVAGIAVFFLNETRVTRNTEANVKAELAMLRDAVKKSPATATTLAGSTSSTRRPVIDPKELMADLTAIFKQGPGEESEKRMADLTKKYGAQLSSAPVSKLKEICELLEKNFPLDQEDSKMARQAWLGILGMASKSDPAWAITKFEQVAAANKAPIEAMLGTFGMWATQQGESMSLSYAGAMQKWLDAAQADGKIEANNPLVTKLRSQIATAQGNQSAAVQQLSKLPYLNQQRAAIDYAATLQTPDAQRQAMEELSASLHIQNFPYFVRQLTAQQGYEAARQVLDSASLTPEKYDLAAASIAATNIGPETPAKAKWLLESLRSEDTRAVKEFADQWAHADYKGAAKWISSLPAGTQRDNAISGFAPVAAKIDGATAMDWALTVSDPLLRNQLYCEARGKWQETDPQQANAYSKSHPLDEEALKAASR